MQQSENNNNKPITKAEAARMYDLYAPAVYGKIISIVHKGPIANRILEKVFTNAFIDKNVPANNLQTPLLPLLNHAREKSYKTIRALNILTECCAGTTVTATDKKQ